MNTPTWSVVIASVALALGGCRVDGNGGADAASQDADRSEGGRLDSDVETGSDATPDADGSDDASEPECVSTVPCVSDTQCVTLPGHTCNRGLPSPLCQLLGCGEDGTPCAQEDLSTYSHGGATDALCESGFCRHFQSGPWLCRADPLTLEECLVVCRSWNELAGCSSEAPCSSLCAMALEERYCGGHGGLSDFHSSPYCSGGGLALCSDLESFSF